MDRFQLFILSNMLESLNKIVNLFKLLRIFKWPKNLLVFAPLIFSKNLLSFDDFFSSLLTFGVFCLLSSSVYVINDLKDFEKDKLHPTKKDRPIASGKISKVVAISISVILFLLSATSSYLLLPLNTLYVFGIYFILNILYTFKLKEIFIIDLISISIGFVLRIIAGGSAIDVFVSPWLIITTFILAMFLASTKRYSDVKLLDGNHASRPLLSKYNSKILNQMMTILAGLIIFAYSMYTLESQYKNMEYTIPFVMYGVFKYLYIIETSDIGIEPERILYKDLVFVMNLIAWVVMAILLIYIF